MTIASGVAKRVAFKKESTWNTAAGASGAAYLRRVKSTLELAKGTLSSAEIRKDYQVEDYRHGTRSVKGAIDGELSAGTWETLLAAACRAAFAAVSDITTLTLTVANATAPFTITRSSGSWTSDGIKVGNVVRLTAGSLNAANLNKNLLVVAQAPTILTVIPLNGAVMVAEGPISSCTLNVPGKKVLMATASQTDDSFSVEHWYSDISQSELFTGCKVNQVDVNLPPAGMATIAFDLMGGDVTTAASQYFSSPSAESTTKILAGPSGVVAVSGSQIVNVTGFSMKVKGNMTADPVVGQNTYDFITSGRMEVEGQLTLHFKDATVRDYFLNETEIAVAVAVADSPAAAADFMCFVLPRVKLGGASRDDGEKALILTCPYTALLNSAGGSGTTSENTTLAIQDSQAT